MASKPSPTKSDTPVPARAALDEQQAPTDPNEPLESQAKEQEKSQRDELKSGVVSSGPVKKIHDHAQQLLKKDDVASVRAGVDGALVAQGGQIDNMTRASDADALEGHFCNIDLSHSSLDKETKDHLGQRDYGVYEQPGSIDPETGRPVLAVVRLRDDTGEKVVVPYESLRPAGSGGRR